MNFKRFVSSLHDLRIGLAGIQVDEGQPIDVKFVNKMAAEISNWAITLTKAAQLADPSVKKVNMERLQDAYDVIDGIMLQVDRLLTQLPAAKDRYERTERVAAIMALQRLRGALIELSQAIVNYVQITGIGDLKQSDAMKDALRKPSPIIDHDARQTR